MIKYPGTKPGYLMFSKYRRGLITLPVVADLELTELCLLLGEIKTLYQAHRISFINLAMSGKIFTLTFVILT